MTPYTIGLTRSRNDRRLYELGSLGSLRLKGWFLRAADARTETESFTVSKTKTFDATVVATDSTAEQLGVFRPRSLRGGGTLEWRGTTYDLSHDAMLAERYSLMDGERVLAEVYARGWWGWGTKRPVELTVHDDRDRALLLFVTFVVRTIANQRNSDAAAVTTATTPTYS